MRWDFDEVCVLFYVWSVIATWSFFRLPTRLFKWMNEWVSEKEWMRMWMRMRGRFDGTEQTYRQYWHIQFLFFFLFSLFFFKWVLVFFFFWDSKSLSLDQCHHSGEFLLFPSSVSASSSDLKHWIHTYFYIFFQSYSRFKHV